MYKKKVQKVAFICANGVNDIIELPLTEEELRQFQASAHAIKTGIDAVATALLPFNAASD